MCADSDKPVCSIIIPTYNEEENIDRLLKSLINSEGSCEIIVVDGGSTDNTKAVTENFKDVTLLDSGKGRAKQMNFGAKHASHSPLVFLHADTSIPASFLSHIESISPQNWGYFKICISSKKRIFRLIEFMMNLRCRLSSVITGDMTLCIGKELFDEAAGYPDLILMEDIAISKTLRKIKSPSRLPAEVNTSARRWEKNGVYSTIVLMWKLRLDYFFDGSSKKLISQYSKQNK